MKKTLLLACALIPVFFASCASFSGHHIDAVESFTKIPSPKGSLLVEVSQNANSMNRFVVETKYGKKEVREIFKKTLDEAGYFREIRVRDSEVMQEFKPEYTLKVSLSYEDSGDFLANFLWAYVSGLTLTVIPYWHKVHFVLKGQLKNSKDKEVGFYQMEETDTTAMELFLIFLTPFKWPSSVEDRITEDLARNLVKQMAKNLM